MDVVEIVDYSEWTPYEGFAEGSGRSEKIWLQSPKGKIGLFKFPKINQETQETTTEYVSEHIACQLGALLGVETAKVDIGLRDGRIGCMSYLINGPKEFIVEGAIFISGNHPDFDMDKLIETSTGKYYCLDHIFEVFSDGVDQYYWIQMMVFDCLIGNSDRHQHNWGYLFGYSDEGQSVWIRPCPLYDNGSSLCSVLYENKVTELLGNDRKRFEAQVDSKSRSMIRIDGSKKRNPFHKEMVRYLLSEYPETKEIVSDFLEKMSDVDLRDFMSRYREVLSENKLELITRFLERKLEILEELRREV